MDVIIMSFVKKNYTSTCPIEEVFTNLDGNFVKMFYQQS